MKRIGDEPSDPSAGCVWLLVTLLLTVLLILALRACGAPLPPVATPPLAERDIFSLSAVKRIYCPYVRTFPWRTPTVDRAILPPTAAPPTPDWLQGEPPYAIPRDVLLALLERTRATRGVELWADVWDHDLVVAAGNGSYGAQISPIVEHEGFLAMETCRGLVVKTPSGQIWILLGFYGPVVPIAGSSDITP